MAQLDIDERQEKWYKDTHVYINFIDWNRRMAIEQQMSEDRTLTFLYHIIL